jgi:hypothetical protein
MIDSIKGDTFNESVSLFSIDHHFQNAIHYTLSSIVGPLHQITIDHSWVCKMLIFFLAKNPLKQKQKTPSSRVFDK